MGLTSHKGKTFLCRLLADRAGNVLAIAAASLLPMMALIGGGVDVSRAYMAKTQLQSACDAGVLAGRKAMSKSGEYTDSEKAKASKMFNFNFDASSLDVHDVVYATDDNDDGQVTGTATATLPTLVMKVFNWDTVDLSVDCMAELQIGNADVMFVLDNTTSMKCAPEDTRTNCTQYAITDSRSKFYGLVGAVKDFHKTINQAVNDRRTRIRYGFVPYAMSVNVSGLISTGAMTADQIMSSNSYQTRVAKFDLKTYIPKTPVTNNSPSPATEWYTNSSGTKIKISSSDCTKYGANTYPSSSGKNPATTGGAPSDLVDTTYAYGGRGTESSSDKSCYRKITKTKTTSYDTKYGFGTWDYKKLTFDTSNFKLGTAITVATDAPKTTYYTTNDKTFNPIQLAAVSGAPTTSTTWNGCIEERKTLQETDFDPVPDLAYDLDFDLPATTDDTKWRPMWSQVEYMRDTYAEQFYYYSSSAGRYYNNASFTGSSVTPDSAIGGYCPAQMKLFTTVDLSDDPDEIPEWLGTYLGTLKDSGYTYHDVGMIWGGRLTSPTGLFKDNVNLDSDKISVSKHIIFMTDGILQPEKDQYSAYGIESLDSRIAAHADVDTIYDRHMSRFVAMCEAIKAQGTTIWVVAFGTTMTDKLKNCASNGRAYYSSNTTALRSTFKFIAAQVADLRLGA